MMQQVLAPGMQYRQNPDLCAKMPGIAEPGGNFPATNLSEEQVRAVAEYLNSLGRAPDGAR